MHASYLFTAATAIAAASAQQSLTDVLSSQSDTLSLFTQIVQKAGLVDTITSMDSATIFAPTNEALRDALDQFPSLISSNSNNNGSTSNSGSLDLENAQLSNRFVEILQYHVVPGAAYSLQDIDVFPGSFYTTALNGYVVNPYQTDDIEYDSGVIHTIDKVLLPPVGPNATALDMGFTYFYGALQQTDLTTDVATADQITVFIPRDQAFIDVGAQLKDLSSQELSTLMRFHVATEMPYYTTNLSDGDTLNTLANTNYESGISISIDESDGALYANNARVITANILLSNGVAHLIDEVMNPENDNSDYGYDYSLDEGGAGVPAFEDAASATIPSLTSGVTVSSTFSPTGTFSAVSGAENLQSNYKMEMLGGGAVAAVLGMMLV
ncbi:hypothetical protein KC332_g16199 [Hortaea werneckii]|uniref:FAS1 domain-containing protein n=1 Tax=Hortaea werneckii EXF-2000 TaxID=1157616 RepID=A0A1Z5SX56_HORWE|nr:hypothetical protein KC358_g16218 [Hortaea werneckii]OTA25403.1 hypothetical protein BTJ68_12216 [Hortaea werneckii EXF-2000]KAI6799529.1 hypothetical protein KC350_g16066 [Hortaea werneckii]KAI6901828.1 hypothetical protein KC348_g16323 [Hortaea werneckii]KAI6921318.1 hypothetical protein KC341_g16004 [Hortaea werneckii]